MLNDQLPNANMILAQLIVQFRALQLSAHNFHNTVSGESFFSDHAFFSDAYGAYEEAYDGLVERLIGLGSPPNLVAVQKMAASQLQDAADPMAMFQALFDGEKQVQSAIEQAAAGGGLSQGTMNLLAGLADDSEVRCYRVQQRLAQSESDAS